jgi:chromatin remodeling complex protein RSC6
MPPNPTQSVPPNFWLNADGPSLTAASSDDDEEPRPKKTKAAPKKRKADASANETAPKKRKAPKKKAETDPDAPKKPSALSRPLLVTPEMSRWLGGATQISRPELTKKFWAYAKVHPA